MIVYSHRGNLNGAIPARENDPDYIDEALVTGVHVEIDLRCVGHQLFLGHDFPQYAVTPSWISHRQSKLLVHVKDLAALQFIGKEQPWHIFCHSNDPFAITNEGWIWLHDLSLVPDENTIVPLITAALVSKYEHHNLYGVCTDYPIAAQRMIK